MRDHPSERVDIRSDTVTQPTAEMRAVMESASVGDGGDIDIVPKLLYECTDDSKSAEAFHESCDGKGATLTVIRCTDGYVFGGYNPGSWTSRGYGRGENAFLFSLVNPVGAAPPTKYIR